MQVIIHKSTKAILWRGTAYLVDGQPGIVIDPLALLDVTADEAPVYDSETETVDWEDVPDYELETYHRTATVRALTEAEITNRISGEATAAAQKVIDEELAKLNDALYVDAVQSVLLLSDADALERAHVFPPFEIGRAYALNERLYYPRDGKLYKVAQAHTSAVEWLPNANPALYVAIAPPGVIAAWVEPTGAHDAYQTGDRVTHNDKTWESGIVDNVWEPGVFGWVEI